LFQPDVRRTGDLLENAAAAVDNINICYASHIRIASRRNIPIEHHG
jgi:hypothetical protein